MHLCRRTDGRTDLRPFMAQYPQVTIVRAKETKLERVPGHQQLGQSGFIPDIKVSVCLVCFIALHVLYAVDHRLTVPFQTVIVSYLDSLVHPSS